jgi:hypothetical protein
LKRWASAHRDHLYDALDSRYVCYGEWLYATHTLYYDQLPHYFLEFDVLDTKTGEFLATSRRNALLANSPIVQVAVLDADFDPSNPVGTLVGTSRYRSQRWRRQLTEAAHAVGLLSEEVSARFDLDDRAEGLYIKIEDRDRVIDRCKWVRSTFSTRVTAHDPRSDRAITNQLIDPSVLFP